MIEIVVETKVRGEWTRYSPACTMFGGHPEDANHAACKIMGEMIADMDWPGTECRVRFNETGEPGDEITILSNDAMLDDYIVEARENLRAYAEAQRYLFRKRIMKDIGPCPNSGVCVCRASGFKRRKDECISGAKRQEAPKPAAPRKPMLAIISDSLPGNVHSAAGFINNVNCAEYLMSLHFDTGNYTTAVFRVPRREVKAFKTRMGTLRYATKRYAALYDAWAAGNETAKPTDFPDTPPDPVGADWKF